MIAKWQQRSSVGTVLGKDGNMHDSMGPHAATAMEEIVLWCELNKMLEPTEITAWDYKGLVQDPTGMLGECELYHIRTNNSAYKVEKR